MPLFAKLIRDLRWNLAAIMLLVGAFQFLWALITERVLGKLAPFFINIAFFAGLDRLDVEREVFEGPGQVLRTIIGGDGVSLDNAMDMLSIGFVHPLMQIVFCIWAIGRASGAVAGEIDRGTMELLLAQPLARSRIILAHFLVDVVTIPLICLAIWAGCCAGYLAIHPIEVHQPELQPGEAAAPSEDKDLSARLRKAFTRALLKLARQLNPPAKDDEALRERLDVRPLEFGRGLLAVGGLIFGICGLTMWLSAVGRFRWSVMGLAVGVVLLMFLINVLGQMWPPAGWLRPFTIFYYYQPQQLIQGKDSLWALAVLYGTGLVGYAGALWSLTTRDLPAPL
jgi:ABC-2 type transport system permease protein